MLPFVIEIYTDGSKQTDTIRDRSVKKAGKTRLGRVMRKYGEDQIFAKRRIRLIGFDLDGTLLTDEKEITPGTEKTLRRAASEGIILVPVTGRPVSGLPKALMELPGIHYAVTSNGARVLNDGETVAKKLMPVAQAKELIEIFRGYDTLIEIYFDGQGYADADQLARVERYMPDPPMARYVLESRLPVPDVIAMFEAENRPVDKIQALFANESERREARARVETIPGLGVFSSSKVNVEATMEVDKGLALNELAEQLGVSLSEIAAFGDGDNDISMLRDAGIGVAMGNAIRAVKDAADVVTATNNEDGVARVIERILDGKETL